MSSAAKQNNVGIDLAGKNVAVAGGTQGIGAATAIRFAQAGADSVYIIGRNKEKADEVVRELKRAGANAPDTKTYEFIQADLSLVSNVQKVVEELKTKAGDKGIHYLITTQGGPPNGSFSLTAEDHEKRFAIQHISRFGLAYLLAESKTLKEAWITVCAPSGTNSAAPDLDDLELKDQGMSWVKRFMKQAKQDGAIEDGLVSVRLFSLQAPGSRGLFLSTGDGSIEYPHLRAFHLFPGYVHTQAAANQGFPYPITLAQSIFGPLLTYTPLGNTPQSFADIPVYLAANPNAPTNRVGKSYFMNQRMKDVGEPKWCVAEGGRDRERLWEAFKGFYE
ncbi:BZ3500_MvSof-1268-A1-R1_Chr2-1g04178 [Microbotryum saponariae]|uniref:BZ3500_MvSof-1268-A1-R1_Chr2-1g04178 protein n=1 Tax=Microbotryum saponariae TaxID=289078 RepID=A0A2X0M8U9_9BASI|nr:BZ3500_MvSof-1268-A1-R1_Chr2-1g04178 [Microbotryum saponariae]SCZ91165.1 BZ3501_MvSof-1269-A2-R1_Chr2-1g03834 [Microbotryum saponariae]